MSFIFLGFDLSPDAMRSLLPYAQQAYENEFLDGEVKIALQNFVNEIKARLQREEDWCETN